MNWLHDSNVQFGFTGIVLLIVTMIQSGWIGLLRTRVARLERGQKDLAECISGLNDSVANNASSIKKLAGLR